MAQQRTGKWVEQILKENGMTKSDLCEQTGLSKETVERLLKDGEATKEVWNIVLGQLNAEPTIDYPSESILGDLENDMNRLGPEAECAVYYGVNSKDLIFTDYQLPGESEHGANEQVARLSKFHITLEEAYELFEKQNMTL